MLFRLPALTSLLTILPLFLPTTLAQFNSTSTYFNVDSPSSCYACSSYTATSTSAVSTVTISPPLHPLPVPPGHQGPVKVTVTIVSVALDCYWGTRSGGPIPTPTDGGQLTVYTLDSPYTCLSCRNHTPVKTASVTTGRETAVATVELSCQRN